MPMAARTSRYRNVPEFTAILAKGLNVLTDIRILTDFLTRPEASTVTDLCFVFHRRTVDFSIVDSA